MRWLQNYPHFLELNYTIVNRILALFDRWLVPGGVTERIFVNLELMIKGPIFDCRMCGQCVLHDTGMTCPMTCPKNMRNGPCGGVLLDGNCEIFPEKACIWVQAWQRSARMADYKEHISLDQRSEPGNPLTSQRVEVLKSGSRLERVLRSGRFAVTAELNPPDSADPQAVYDRALVLAEVCDAINATDASGANVHMSSVGMCALLTRAGYEPIMQVSCRDRNRIAIQGDLLGAAAMGVRNVLCLTGDGVQTGDQPEAKGVFDLDSISLLRTARTLTDQGRFLSGRKLDVKPRFFLGGASNPFVPPFDFRPQRLLMKVKAGADFIQTQYCFDVPRLQKFIDAFRQLDLDETVYILVGVGPLRSARAALWMRTKIPGVIIPDEIIDRLSGVPPSRQQAEGKQICVEIIEQVREIEGVCGVHVMAYRQEELVAEIIEEAGLLPRRWQYRRDKSKPSQEKAN